MKNKNNNFQYIDIQFSFRFNLVVVRFSWNGNFADNTRTASDPIANVCSRKREIDVNVYNAIERACDLSKKQFVILRCYTNKNV